MQLKIAPEQRNENDYLSDDTCGNAGVSLRDVKQPRKDCLFRELGVPALNNETVFVELCAGSGILSSSAEKYGMKSCPIDCERNRHSPFTKIFQIDLTDDREWSFLEHVRDTAKVVAWHMGLPCGTCSRARDSSGKSLEPSSS